jgi:3-hydroxyisobutyrate dehydrogenase-like beta-hydroxyacid dehydrogenase
MKKGSTFIDMSTSSVDVAHEVMAAAGPLGGIPDQIVHAGPNGAGYAIKVLLNVLWFIHAAGTAEVLAVASRLGVDLRVLQRALEAYGPKSGEMSVVKLYEDASGTTWRLPPA